MKITYGIKGNSVDVTDICNKQMTINGVITIPSGDRNRSRYFTDHINGTLKIVFIAIDNDTILEFNESVIIKINIIEESITIINLDDEINKIHNELYINHGDFNDELPEQKMVLRYITGNEKILELGGNIGRNSLIIGYILDKSHNNNFVTLESDTLISEQLIENRNLNNFKFHVENSALSKRNLIQKKLEWDTLISDEILEGYNKVNIICLEELKEKYNIDFDTLIIDCEGAFYYILVDMPELLDNINLIIMENDYTDLLHKEYVDKILKENNFYVDYVEEGGWDPCYSYFYEVWKKQIIC